MRRITRTIAKIARIPKIPTPKRSYMARAPADYYAITVVNLLKEHGKWPIPNELTKEQIMNHILNINTENGHLWLELNQTPTGPYTNPSVISFKLPNGEDGEYIESTALSLRDAINKRIL